MFDIYSSLDYIETKKQRGVLCQNVQSMDAIRKQEVEDGVKRIMYVGSNMATPISSKLSSYMDLPCMTGFTQELSRSVNVLNGRGAFVMGMEL
jgi:hypothetical protein